jgi:hypothetical protein
LEPVPRDVTDAVLRELVAFIPVIGDVFCAYEVFEALKRGKTLPALAYLLSVLPGPPLPLTHLLVYVVEKGEFKL